MTIVIGQVRYTACLVNLQDSLQTANVSKINSDLAMGHMMEATAYSILQQYTVAGVKARAFSVMLH